MSEDVDTRDKVIDLLERRVKEVQQSHQAELERLRHIQEEAKQQLFQEQQARIKELLAQNDGMLGVVGRLQTENQDLRKKLTESETECERTRIKAQIQSQIQEQDVQRLREKYEMELERLRTENAKLKKGRK